VRPILSTTRLDSDAGTSTGEPLPRSVLPDLVVAGAQKAATTMIAAALAEHPQAEMLRHETHDFADPMYKPGAAQRIGARFTGVALRHGFKCASYLGQPEVPERLAVDLGMPDVIFALRDPVKRAVSAWYWYMRLGHVPVQPVNDAFRRLLGSDLSGPEQRHELEVLDWGLYAKHLEHWLRFFPRDKIHLVFDIDLRRSPAGTIVGLYEALGLDPTVTPTVQQQRHNDGVYSYSRIRWLRRRLRWVWRQDADGVSRPQRPTRLLPAVANAGVVAIDRYVLARLDRCGPPVLDADVEQALRDYYRADTLQLQSLAGTSLASWLAL